MTVIPTLKTDRLTLRGPKESDAGPFGAFMASPRAAWIGGPYPTADAPDWLAHQQTIWDRRGWGAWIAALSETDAPIGRVGLLDHQGWHEPELAWFLFDGYEGQGYAMEAALAARDQAARLGLPPLFSFIEPANLRSRALALRLGARHESDVEFKDHHFHIYRHPAGGAA
jgi:RimJ/RimL family protein N-acetyltransferase